MLGEFTSFQTILEEFPFVIIKGEQEKGAKDPPA
jgi:hypothetical protein